MAQVDVVADTVTEHARAGAGMITDPAHPLYGDRELHLDHEIASRGEARIEASPPRSVTSNYTRGFHPESSVKCNETSGTPPRDRQRRTRNGNDRRRRNRACCQPVPSRLASLQATHDVAYLCLPQTKSCLNSNRNSLLWYNCGYIWPR